MKISFSNNFLKNTEFSWKKNEVWILGVVISDFYAIKRELISNYKDKDKDN